jgi:NAD-dependent histone deacetylase SIR2
MQICLLGDADTIVTYLSQEIGWQIPPPAAVMHSPPAEDKTKVEEDDLRLESLTQSQSQSRTRPIPPYDEVVWRSGVGDM